MNQQNLYLAHHGIKGQKWGVRRYQNSDGSLTPEGYRRYGKGTGKGLIGKHLSANTDARAKQGRKIGAIAGTGLGIAGAAAMLSPAIATGIAVTNPAGLAALGASYVASSAIGGAAQGYRIGSIVGAVETHRGRDYIHDRATMFNDKKAKEFVKNDYRVK